VLVADDFGNDEIGVGGRAHGQSAGRNCGETILSKVGEPVVGCGLEGRGFDDARGHKIEIAETQIVARIEGGIATNRMDWGLLCQTEAASWRKLRIAKGLRSP